MIRPAAGKADTVGALTRAASGYLRIQAQTKEASDVKRIEWRPDLRTAGGEVNDILVDGRFVGTMALVWREGGRLTGSVQLDRDALHARDKQRVLDRINEYVQSFVLAVGAATCEVFVTYSPFEQFIVTADDAEDEIGGTWRDADEEPEWQEAEYELVLVGKKRNRLHYHVYDDRRKWLAEAHLRAEDGRVTGSVEWRAEPDDDEIELVTELIVSDFDEDSVDEFRIDHRHGDMLVETVELSHEEEAVPEAKASRAKKAVRGEANFTARLIRDDGDALTYEIRSKADANRTIGTATVDIRERRLTGFIDFRDRRHADDAGAIAAVLMRELDKEKEYDGLSLSLMYRNKLIDEFIVENETVH